MYPAVLPAWACTPLQCLALKGHPLARVLLENLSSLCGQKAELKKSTSDSCEAILAGGHVAGFNPCPADVDADMAFISSGSRETVALSTHTLGPSLGPNHTRVLWPPPLGGAIARTRLETESGSEPEGTGQETLVKPAVSS